MRDRTPGVAAHSDRAREPETRGWTTATRVTTPGRRGTSSRRSCTGRPTSERSTHVLSATREGDLVLFTDWQGDADERLTGEPGSGGARGAGRRGRARRRRPGPGVAFAPRPDRLLRHREPAPRRAAPAPRGRGAAGHARPGLRLAPPEVRGRPAPRRPLPRCGLRRRDRPGPQPPRRCRPPRRPAGPATHRRVRRRTRPGTTSRCGSRARRSTTSRPCSGNGGRTPPAQPKPAAPALPTGFAASTLRPGPLPAQQPPPPRGRGAYGPAAADLSEPAARPRLSRSPAAASAAWRGATPRRSHGPAAWSTSRTSTSGGTTSPNRSSPRCGTIPSCASSW